MPSLQQMRALQGGANAAPEVHTGDDGAPDVDGDRPKVVRQQIQTPKLGLRGYLRILPQGKNSVADLTGDWIIEFWDKPSPWCRIEGEPEHPEFENNLKAFEAAP